MKIVVTIIIHTRIENLKRWAACWQLCEKENTELRVIHNYKVEEDIEIYRNICLQNGITYIPRPNLGLDIGALQDVCRERLNGFDNDYDYLMWITDDCLPMNRDFVQRYLRALTAVDMVCMEISDETARHIRTSGLMARKNLWTQFVFPSDPLTDKSETYDFEHRGGEKTMLAQLEARGKKFIQISDLKTSPLWDTDHRESLNRWAEFYNTFPETKKVVIFAPIYNTFPEIVSSLICQTYKDWQLILLHDGPNHTNLKRYIDAVSDSRITYIEWPDRLQNYGHQHRKWFLDELKAGRLSDAGFVVITNADNYLVPTFLEYMIKPFEEKSIIASYCSEMTHSYWGGVNKWASGKCRLERGYIDCSGVMIRREAAQDIGWQDMSHSSDWIYFDGVIRKYGVDKWVKIPGNLLVHN